jgi:hypothetical protein
LIDEAGSLMATFETSDERIRQMMKEVEQNFLTTCETISQTVEEAIFALRKRSSQLIEAATKIKNEKIFALSAQSKQLTNYIADLRVVTDAILHYTMNGAPWELPLIAKLFHDLQVSFNPLTRLQLRTLNDIEVCLNFISFI